MRPLYRFLLAAMLLPSCDRKQAGPVRQSASARATPAVALAVSASATPAPELELLHRTASLVVTSSHADADSTGAYLVDELLETSWKANPPDSAPWLEINLPAPALIERIELALARSSNADRAALASAARVLIPEASASGGWAALPTKNRLTAGGDALLQLVPQEVRQRLRVSLRGSPRVGVAELRAIGSIAVEQLLEPALPETQVQGNAPSDYQGNFGPWLLGAPYADEAALCGAFAALPIIDAAGERPRRDVCRKLPALAVQGTLPAGIRSVERYVLTLPDDVMPMETVALVVQGEQGLYPANLPLTDDRNEGMCPGGVEGGLEATSFRSEHGVLLIARTHHFSPGALMLNLPESAPPVSASSIVRCKLEGRLSCREFITHFSTPGKRPDPHARSAGSKPPVSWERTLSITHGGRARLGPCQVPAAAAGQPRVTVPCATPGAEVLWAKRL